MAAAASSDYDDLGGGESARLNTLPRPYVRSARACALAESSARGAVEALRVAFVNERCAPDLLPHQDDLVNEVKDLITEQAREREAGTFPPPAHSTCRAAQVNRINELDESQTLKKDLYNMELERINYMLRNYMRDRLRKVCACSSPRNPHRCCCTLPDHPPALASGRRTGSEC